jgi:hypothetical protein
VFDLVDHDNLLRKMAGMAQNWFQSYLENGKKVEIAYRCKETTGIINCLS